MKNIKFLIVGILFGIIMTKSEAISWYRIYEMFKFQSFHMYGIIGSAVAVSMVLMYFFKNGKIKDYQGNKINIKEKKKGIIRTLVGGTIFGLGWALAGACPAPIFVLIGHGIFPVIIVLIGAMLGAFIYGLLSKKLPN
ncbi:YeeE/YedE family protein [Tenacibaculum haliotis]|uniref:YeeE/YedE family protein n=1 Tax=Tenacibaculum haliotis TaxID=1888914 RepID=UPI0021B07057|nr:YeeE/YedE family protein [Tenacibaculum haliotis]MCT4699340.1 YeeE/YedE family protein [Tenacibaculum haliotis]